MKKFSAPRRFSTRTPPNGTPNADSESARHLQTESGLETARRRAKLALREKGQGLPPRGVKTVLSAGAGFSIPKNLEPELGSSGSAG